MSEEIKLKHIKIWICQMCLDGKGEECHTPDCALYLHSVDLPIDSRLYEIIEQQPTAGEFTKKARKYCNSVIEFAQTVKDTVSEETKDVITKKLFDLLFEGFDIIDRAEAINKELLEACEGLAKFAAKDMPKNMKVSEVWLLELRNVTNPIIAVIAKAKRDRE